MTIIKKFDPEEKNERKISKKFLLPTLASLFVLVLLQIWANNTVVTYGEKFQTISNLQKNLQLENQTLENQIAKEATLSKIATQSAALGFSKPESIQYIR